MGNLEREIRFQRSVGPWKRIRAIVATARRGAAALVDQPEFAKLRIGQTISLFGSEVSHSWPHP